MDKVGNALGGLFILGYIFVVLAIPLNIHAIARALEGIHRELRKIDGNK